MEERLIALLRLAIKYNASDIHFNIKYEDISIYMRVDGLMRKVKTNLGDERLIRYLQYLANLDVGNLTKPQTGQFEMEIDGEILSLRFALMSGFNITSGVLRILNANIKINVYNLSRNIEQNEYFKKLLLSENGLVIFSGPTGSGKTTTLYTLLSSVNNRVIYTIEDPIEVYNDNFVQLQINEKLGFDYEAGIKQIMRHDPDIIMIGEIRDKKAAKMAVVGANTGHLVFSTIHASSASSIISRMIDLGANKSHFIEMLLCLVNQRMIIDKQSRKTVIYEIMDREEIEYFINHNHNSDRFISIDSQIKKGKEDGIY